MLFCAVLSGFHWLPHPFRSAAFRRMSYVPLPRPSHYGCSPNRLRPSHSCAGWEGHAVESRFPAGPKPDGRLRSARRMPCLSLFALWLEQGRAEDFQCRSDRDPSTIAPAPCCGVPSHVKRTPMSRPLMVRSKWVAPLPPRHCVGGETTTPAGWDPTRRYWQPVPGRAGVWRSAIPG